MVTLFKILLFGIVIYYFFKLAGKFLLSFLFKNIESKLNNTAGDYNTKTEGELTIQNNTKKNNNTKNVGEYVDFEEIE